MGPIKVTEEDMKDMGKTLDANLRFHYRHKRITINEDTDEEIVNAFANAVETAVESFWSLDKSFNISAARIPELPKAIKEAIKNDWGPLLITTLQSSQCTHDASRCIVPLTTILLLIAHTFGIFRCSLS